MCDSPTLFLILEGVLYEENLNHPLFPLCLTLSTPVHIKSLLKIYLLQSVYCQFHLSLDSSETHSYKVLSLAPASAEVIIKVGRIASRSVFSYVRIHHAGLILPIQLFYQ